MLKKILLILLAVIIVVPAAGLGFLYMKKPAQAPASGDKVPMTPERIARGRVIFELLSDCSGCHSQRDFTLVAGPVVESGRGRGNVLSDVIPELPGKVVAPNITPDPETGIGTWTDGEKIRAIREGVDKDGRTLFPMMPYGEFRSMSDEDVQAVVAYLNSLPPIKNPLPQTQVKFPVNLMIKFSPRPVGSVPSPERTDKLKYGQYLVGIGGCQGCHTPEEKGQPLPGMNFGGGRKFATTFGTVVSANITPDLDTGIGKWTEDFFLKKFYDYKDYVTNGAPKLSGPEAFTLMPWLALSQLPSEDLSAIYTYLRTLKPLRNAVETHPGAPKPAAAPM
jgi:mono/diheme cytochrome c family protein